MTTYLHKKQIGSIKPYKDIAENAHKHFGYTGDCPVSEQISKRVLMIPSYYRLRMADVQRIAKCVNKGWSEMRKCDVDYKR